MKKTLLLLAALMLLFALAACGAEEPAAQPVELNTLGDALSAESSYNYAGWNSETYVYVFDNGGPPYRVVAEMTQELYDAIDQIEFTDPEKDAKLLELVGDLPLISVENLAEGIPSQEELDQLVGKTGQELTDEGFSIWGFTIDGDQEEFTLAQGPYEYIAVFNEPAPTGADTTEAETIRDLTLKSITYDGLSSHCVDIEGL